MFDNCNENKEKTRCKFCYVQGPTGPTGPAGAATITVGTTTTTDAGSNASVTNSGTNENVILDFSIPRGSIGPTGGVAAYGERYTEGAETVTLTPNQDGQIPLQTNGPSLNTTYTTSNAITVGDAGTYQIYYLLDASSSQQADITVFVRKNNTEIDGSSITLNAPANENKLFTGSIITTLAAGDVIDFVANSGTGLTLTLDSNTGARVSIIKLG